MTYVILTYPTTSNPERYENLQVRVCGWNVRWNDIPKVEQDKFILRQEAIAR